MSDPANTPVPEKRILLVEDEATTREIITHVLRAEGYVVDSVANGGAATTCLKSITYTLVIADWLLPDGNGVDIADAAMSLGAKTLIISGFVSSPPPGAERHQFLTKQPDSGYILDAVQRSIGPPSAL